MDLKTAATHLEDFSGSSLAGQIASLEQAYSSSSQPPAGKLNDLYRIDSELLSAAITFKKAAGQIHVIVHAVGILLSLPEILEEDEKIEYLSLGAGNTGRPFDLETNKRVAEFKFISWKGGAETIRQNALFKDFYGLAEAHSSKLRCLYVIGLDFPLKFFKGKRLLRSVMSRNSRLWSEFEGKYGNRFERVYEYYSYRTESVKLIDISEMIPAFVEIV